MTPESVKYVPTLRLTTHLHYPETGSDTADLLDLIHEVETLTAQLADANERNRTLADDLARYALKNAALEVELKREMYTASELRLQLLLANRDDAGHPRPPHMPREVQP